jgi:hypothetical protein
MGDHLQALVALTPGKEPHKYPLDRGLGGPRIRFENRGEMKILYSDGAGIRILRSFSEYSASIRTVISLLQ